MGTPEYKQKRLLLLIVIAVLAGLVLLGTVTRNADYAEIDYLFPAFSTAELKSIHINGLTFVNNSGEMRLTESKDIPLDSNRLNLLLNAFRKARIVRTYRIDDDESSQTEDVFNNAYVLGIEFTDYSVEYQVGFYADGQQYIQNGQHIMVVDTLIHPFLKDSPSYWYDYKVIDRSIQQAGAIALVFTGDFFDEDFQLSRTSSDEKGDVWQWNDQDVPAMLIERFFSRLHGLEGSELTVLPAHMVQTGSILIGLSNGRDYILSLYSKSDSSLEGDTIWISDDRKVFYKLKPAALTSIPRNALSLLQPGE